MSTNSTSEPGQGEFHAKKPGSEPLTTKGHAPGVLVGNDAVPGFHMETHPAGTVPPEDSFRPNPVHEVPGQANNPNMDKSTRADPLDFPGVTSGDMHNADKFGKPVQGQSSKELHGGHGKKERSGLEGVGASSKEGSVEDKVRQLGADMNIKGVESHPGLSADELAFERR